MSSIKQEYPKFLYRGQEAVLVQNEEEHKARGKEYREAPYELDFSREAFGPISNGAVSLNVTEAPSVKPKKAKKGE